MFSVIRPRRWGSLTRTRPLTGEPLDPRQMLHGDDTVPWVNRVITFSLAPDGTDLAGAPSGLFAQFDALAPRAAWQAALRSGFQNWLPHANVQFVEVADQGAPFGAEGFPQGDSRFGDVRIGSRPLSPDVYAVSVPHDAVTAGTWSGDILFNSAANFRSVDELFGVMLHEVGHVLGLEHSVDASSIMFQHGIPPGRDLGATDKTAVALLYGPRPSDVSEDPQWIEPLGFTPDVIRHAMHLDLHRLAGDALGSLPTLVHGDIAKSQDVDWYRVEFPEEVSSNALLTVRSDTLSLLEFTVTVFDRDGHMVQTETADVAGRVAFTRQASEQALYVRIAGKSPAFGVGSYSLTVSFPGVTQLNPSALESASDGRFRAFTDDEIARILAGSSEWLIERETEVEDGVPITELPSDPSAPANRLYRVASSLASLADQDRFRIRAPLEIAGGPWQLRVQTAASVATIAPQITLLDIDGNALASQVLVASANQQVLQLNQVAPGQELLVQISGPAGLKQVGNYTLQATFGRGWQLPVQVDEVLVRGGQVSTQLEVGTPQLLQLTGSVSTGEVRVQVLNDLGVVIGQQVLTAAGPQSLPGLLLVPGRYTLRYQALGGSGPSLPRVRLWGISESGPFATLPVPVDPPSCPSRHDVICFANGFWVFVVGFIPGDIDGDGHVGIQDFVVFRNQFGSAGTDLAADINGDGVVDITDFVMLRRNFGL